GRGVLLRYRLVYDAERHICLLPAYHNRQHGVALHPFVSLQVDNVLHAAHFHRGVLGGVASASACVCHRSALAERETQGRSASLEDFLLAPETSIAVLQGFLFLEVRVGLRTG